MPWLAVAQLPPAHGTGPATRPLSYRQLKPNQGHVLPRLVLHVGGLVELLVVVDAERATSRRDGVAPTPPICGVKKRAATLDITTNAVKPWKFGTLARTA